MSRGGRVAAAAIVIAGAGFLGFFGYRFLAARGGAGRPSERALVATLARSETPSGAQATSAAGLGARVPEQLPDLGFPDRKGTVRHLADWRGRPLIVNFWATWCAPCRREIPLLERLERSHAAEHLQVVGIAVDDRAAVLKYANAMKIDYPVLIGGENGGLQAIDALGMADVLPFTVFADGQGQILTVKVGEL
ncbi:MAG: TlpA family protein disulfide reductase, partial [Steroidobacteraceae bacterium]